MKLTIYHKKKKNVAEAYREKDPVLLRSYDHLWHVITLGYAWA